MARFELATPCSQSRCATKLRYIPGVLQPNGGVAATRSNVYSSRTIVSASRPRSTT